MRPALETTRNSLVLRIRDRGDSVAWREFDAIYRPILERFARMRGLSADAADDVVQQCMTTVSEHIIKFDYDPAKGRFKGWLRTIIQNVIHNEQRKRGEVQADTAALDRATGAEPAADTAFDQIWQREHLKYCLERVRAKIEDSTYRAFQAYALEERPVDDVCAELNMTQRQVRLIKWRVTQMLREQMRYLIGDEGLDDV